VHQVGDQTKVISYIAGLYVIFTSILVFLSPETERSQRLPVSRNCVILRYEAVYSLPVT